MWPAFVLHASHAAILFSCTWLGPRDEPQGQGDTGVRRRENKDNCTAT